MTRERPRPFGIGRARCRVVRGPDPSDPDLWYWRAEVGKRCIWTGWGTPDSIRQHVIDATPLDSTTHRPALDRSRVLKFSAVDWAAGLLASESEGHVYFVAPVGGGLVKIGWTSGYIGDRIAALQTGSPVRLELLLAFPAPRDAEPQLHDRFARLREHGEWFRPTEELHGFITGLRFFWEQRQPKEPSR